MVHTIPAHAQNDHFSRVLAPFERIVRVDRHGLLPYQDSGSEVRNGTDEGFSVWVPDLPGCASQGQTEEEALDNIRDAIREYMSVAREVPRNRA